MKTVRLSLSLSLFLSATAATAGDVFRGNWGGDTSAPDAIDISNGNLVSVCNFGQCFHKVRYEMDGKTYVLTNGSQRWTFVKAPGHPGFNAVYWEKKSDIWTQVAGAKMEFDPDAAKLSGN